MAPPPKARKASSWRLRGVCFLAARFVFAAGLVAANAVAQPDDTPNGLFASGCRALAEGRAGDAIGAFEALADRGVVDPAASYDRGLAYATRVRIGAESPGDLGRAIEGFEEARDLARDAKLAEDASRALAVVRGEVARRRMRAGQPAAVDAGPSLARAVAGLLAEDTWAILSVVASVSLTLGLFARWLSQGPKARVGGGVLAGVAAPLLAVAVAMTMAARHDRSNLREAIVVAPSARAIDSRGIAVAGGATLPEGARVEIVGERSGATRVRSGPLEAWVSTGLLREIARPE